MRIGHIINLFTFSIATTSIAQSPQARFTQENGDCTGAITINDTIFTVDHAVRGFGNILEIKENPIEHDKWFEREHHTTWYKFRVPVECNLTFDIIPKNIDDDIDFLLFEGDIPGICEKIPTKEVEPVRSNISRNDPAIGSKCGLSKEATDQYVRSGVGASYSSSIDVAAGQLFYLVIDHQDRPRSGYTIHFHYDPPPPPPEEKSERKMQKLSIEVKDESTGSPIEANVIIQGMKFDEVVEGSGSDRYDYEMEPYRNLKIACVRNGYMFTNMNVKGCSDPEVKVEVRMKPIVTDEHVVLEDIRFVGDADKVMKRSENALLLLLRFMQMNPQVMIEIQGHVNGPTFKNKKEFIELSTARAKTVHDFLLVNDIDQSRITYKGLGNSQMLFPDPKNKDESEANRRVEIKVVGT